MHSTMKDALSALEGNAKVLKCISSNPLKH